MSITFPKTWTTEVLEASDVMDNFDAIQKKSHRLLSSDVTTDKWIDTRHIVNPDYNPYTNIMTGVSGVFGGQNSGGFFSKYTYLTKWLSGKNSGVENAIPHTGFTLDLQRPCSLFYQWWACVMSPNNGAGTTGTGKVYFYTHDPSIGIGTPHLLLEQPYASPHDPTFDGTYHTNGFGVVEVSSEKLQYGIGLTGSSTAGQNRFISWGVSFEAFYL